MMKNSQNAMLTLLLGGASLTLISCGASSNSAPVVYGTEPATGRIYNSPADIYLEKPAQRSPSAFDRQGPLIAAQNAPAVTSNSVYRDPQYRNPQYLAPIQGSVQNTVGSGQTQTGRIYNRSQVVAAQSSALAQNQGGIPIYRSSVEAPGNQQIIRTEVGNLPIERSSYRGLPPAPTYLEPDRSRSVIGAPVGNSIPVRNIASSIRVQPGDTVYAISRRTGAAPGDIIAVNNLVPPYNLSVGQILSLPGNAPTAAPYTEPFRDDISRSISYSPTRSTSLNTRAPTPTGRVGEVIARDVLYRVNPGDTLYSIARKHGVSIQDIAESNRMRAPYALSVGHQLLIPAVPINQNIVQRQNISTPPSRFNAPISRDRQSLKSSTNYVKPADLETLTREASYTKPLKTDPQNLFSWPVKGAVISRFGDGGIARRNDGINIAAPQGATIRAAAAGEVVYRGSGPDGFGNLLLIKHEGGYVSAYAHNDVMLVRKGQRVKRGQIIAKVGKTGAVNEPQLHFEIRQNLKSVDPLAYLAKR